MTWIPPIRGARRKAENAATLVDEVLRGYPILP